MIGTFAGLVVNAVSGLVLAQGAYWTGLCLLALKRPGKLHPSGSTDQAAIAVVVPAHNEVASIVSCVGSVLRSAEVDGSAVSVVVVAHNCTDATAPLAREAGATVVEEEDNGLAGKPAALDAGLAWLAKSQPPDIVAFVDGDCEVDEQFLPAVRARFGAGARAVQCHYTTPPGGSGLQRLRRLALMLTHWARPLGAERLGVGTTLKGSGMALDWHSVKDGFGAYGIAEDAELSLRLSARGIRVEFEPGAAIRGPMAATFRDARTQDRRWEGGRLALLPRALLTAWRSLRRGRMRTAAAAMEVAALPLTLLALLSAGAAGLAFVGIGSAWLAGAALLSLTTYVTAGLVAARSSLRDLTALCTAPGFLIYKAGVLLELAIGRRPTAWHRTNRS